MLICSFQHNNQQQSVFTSYSFRSVSFILQTIRFSLISLYIFFVVNFVNIIYFLKIPIWFDFNSVVICFIFLVVDMTHQSIMIVVILVIELFFFLLSFVLNKPSTQSSTFYHQLFELGIKENISKKIITIRLRTYTAN